MAGQIEVLRAAAGIPGIRGVELQMTAGSRDLRDRKVLLEFKREADRWDVRIPSLAGVFPRGVSISAADAPANLRAAIRAAAVLGSGVILVAFFKEHAPDMALEASYGPVVQNLRAVSDEAADAGVVLGIENSLSPADNARLVDLVGHPAVRVYYDLHNMATYGHGADAVPGVKLLGRQRICAVHVKNGDQLIERPGPIDWPAAFEALNAVGYGGWYIYETQHATTPDCVAHTALNNAFLKRHIHMPADPS